MTSMTNIFVGNLPYQVDDQALRECFEQYGAVSKATVVRNRETGQSRGFGFVEMSDDQEALQALDLNGMQWSGRRLAVRVAEPRNGPVPAGVPAKEQWWER